MMSVILSLNTVLSLLSFLTVVFALARVGAAAFSANQPHPSSSSQADPTSKSQVAHRSWLLNRAAAQPAAHLLQLQLAGGGAMSSFVRFGPTSDFAQAVQFGLFSGSDKSSEKEKDREGGKMLEYVGGHDLVRMPASTWTGVRRPGLLFRPPSLFPEQTEPLSMAKLIMSRHQQNPRRTNRPPIVRRPPGLPSLPSMRSRLVEEV